MTTMVTEKPASPEVTRTEPAWNRPLFRPNVDILERADELTILADIPGASPEDIDIRFENGTLTLHAKVRQRQARDTGYALTEYGIGDFQHTFQVSESRARRSATGTSLPRAVFRGFCRLAGLSR